MAGKKKGNKKKKDDKKDSKLTKLPELQVTLVKEERCLNSILGKRIINESIDNEEKTRKKKTELIQKYSEEYKKNCDIFMSRGTVIEPRVMSRCCSLMNEAKNYNYYEKVTLITLKTLIRSVVRDTLHLVYIFSDTQTALRYLASGLHDNSIEFDYSVLVNKAYAEVFDEMRLQQKRGKKYG